MTARKSVKEIFPVPSLSTSLIIFLISSFFGSKPRALIATWGSVRQDSGVRHTLETNGQHGSTFTLSSLTSIYPDPSVSNSSKASLISCFCSSVSSGLGVVFLRGGGTGPCRDGLLALVAWQVHRKEWGFEQKYQAWVISTNVDVRSSLWGGNWHFPFMRIKQLVIIYLLIFSMNIHHVSQTQHD